MVDKRVILITEGESRGQMKIEAGAEKSGHRPMPEGPPPALQKQPQQPVAEAKPKN
jgi:hypothetical protein